MKQTSEGYKNMAVVLAIATTIGFLGWNFLPLWSNFLTIVGSFLMIIILTMFKVIRVKEIFKEIDEKISLNERVIRRVQMYEYTRGKEYARKISQAQRTFCDIQIGYFNSLKEEVITVPFVGRAIDKKISEIENQKNKMMILG